MGASIGIHAVSAKARQRMLDFMAKEYRPHWQIRGYEERDCFSSPPIEDPWGIQGRSVIGIDYKGGGFERGYAFVLTRWMALKISKTRSTFKDPKVGFKKPVPYMIYDGIDHWPVLQQPLSKTPKKLHWCCVDRYGLKLDPSSYDDFVFDVKGAPGRLNEARAEANKKFGIEGDWPWKDIKDEPPTLRWDIHDEWLRILWPEIQEVVAPIQAEMRRLDTAWAQHT